MKTEIEISKQQVMRQVEMATAYIGAKSENPAVTYQRVAAGESDRDMLDGWWAAATARADVCLGRWLVARHDSCGGSESYRVTICIPPLFNAARIEALCHTMRDMIVAHIMANWLAVVLPGYQQQYADRCELMVMQLKRTMNTGRKKRMEVV